MLRNGVDLKEGQVLLEWYMFMATLLLSLLKFGPTRCDKIFRRLGTLQLILDPTDKLPLRPWNLSRGEIAGASFE